MQLNLTGDSSIKVTLDTTGATVATTRTEGNNFIAKIANAVLALPNGQEFHVNNPTQGIIAIIVTQLKSNRI